MRIDPDIQKSAVVLYEHLYATNNGVSLTYWQNNADFNTITRALQAERDAGKERLREAKNVFQEIAQKWPDSFAARSARAFLAKEGSDEA